MLSNVYLHLQLPKIEPNSTLCRSWGMRMVDRLSYLWGSANVSQLSIDFQSHFQMNMQSAPTSEKKSEIARLSGEEQLVATANPVDAYVPLHLPWSSMGMHKKPFDTRLLNAPVQISIKLADANRVYGGTGVRPAALLAARMLINQGNLGYTEMSLEGELNRNPALRYNYPFIHAQSNQVTVIASGGVPAPTITLNGFINADLLGILISVVKESDVFDNTNNSRNPFNCNQEVRDVTVSYNGLVMYEAPEQIHKLYSLKNNLGSQQYQSSLIAPGVVGPFTSTPLDSYIIDVLFGSYNPLPFCDEFQNTWRIANNVINLQFTANTSGTFLVMVTYLYNGLNSVNGDSLIYFD